MEITSRHPYATSFLKCQEAFLKGAGAEGGKNTGPAWIQPRSKELVLFAPICRCSKT